MKFDAEKGKLVSPWRYMEIRPSGVDFPRSTHIEIAVNTSRITVPNNDLPDLIDGLTQVAEMTGRKAKQSSSLLEHVIVRIAQQRLSELESYAKEHDTIADVQSRFSELTGLTELAKLQDNGLSELAMKQLDDIDAAALKIMRDLAQ